MDQSLAIRKLASGKVVTVAVTNMFQEMEIRGRVGARERGAQQVVQVGIFAPKFAHKSPDLHRNKGLAGTRICEMILSTEEQSSR